MHLLSRFHAPRRRLTPLLTPAIAAALPPLQPLRILSQPHQPSSAVRTFTASATLLRRRKRKGPAVDSRITLIRYHLQHPRTPRPLRLSRNRSLRHWTIHRAWQLYRAKQRTAQELSLERQFNSMRSACEALRLIGEDGLAITQPGNAIPPPGARDPKSVTIPEEGVEMDVKAASERQRNVGRLYRAAMTKTGVWGGVPIEYARCQTDTPPRNGWDHAWTR